MKLHLTERFRKDYGRLPQRLQRRVDKQLRLLLQNPRHPSLQIKRMQGHENRWEGRVTLHYRLTFALEGDTYVLLRVATHDLLK